MTPPSDKEIDTSTEPAKNGADSLHVPYPVTVEVGEDVGGVKVITGMVTQIRCGCTDSLEHDYGHEQEAT